MRPARRAAAAPAIASSSSRGPHTGQAIGCAWKRRSCTLDVLRGAVGAHREPPHGRAAAVVRDVLDDRVPRPAVRAVDERVAVPAVGGIEQLGLTLGAGREIGQHAGALRLRRVARDDLEALVTQGREPRRFARQHHGRGWPLELDPLLEAIHHRLGAFDLDDQPRRRVHDRAAQAELAGQPVHERPEPHALHRAVKADPDPRDAGVARDPRGHGLDGPGHLRRDDPADVELPALNPVDAQPRRRAIERPRQPDRLADAHAMRGRPARPLRRHLVVVPHRDRAGVPAADHRVHDDDVVARLPGVEERGGFARVDAPGPHAARHQHARAVVAPIGIPAADDPHVRSISSFRKWVAHEMHGS